MRTHSLLLAGVAGAAITLAAGGAMAGPCSDQISELGRKLSESPALGPVTSGTLQGSGATPGSTPGGKQEAGSPGTTGTSADNRVGGSGATKEANAAVGNLVATSSDDVRRQQEGLPTAAATAGAASKDTVETKPQLGSGQQPNDKMARAKMELEKARMLDQSGNKSCEDAVKRTREMMNG